MALADHYDELVDQHTDLESRIAAELERPMPDTLTLQRLKRRKLLIKDQIESREGVMRTMRAGPDITAIQRHTTATP